MTEPQNDAILAAIANLSARIDNLEANMNAGFQATHAGLERVEAAILEVGDKLLTGYEMTKVREKLNH
jgi:hypothetical protein